MAVLRLFLAEGADVAAIDKRGSSPLLIAIIVGHDGAARALLDAGADRVRLLREEGRDVSSQYGREGEGRGGGGARQGRGVGDGAASAPRRGLGRARCGPGRAAQDPRAAVAGARISLSGKILTSGWAGPPHAALRPARPPRRGAGPCALTAPTRRCRDRWGRRVHCPAALTRWRCGSGSRGSATRAPAAAPAPAACARPRASIAA